MSGAPAFATTNSEGGMPGRMVRRRPERIPNEAGEQRRQDIGAVPGLERRPAGLNEALDKAWILR